MSTKAGQLHLSVPRATYSPAEVAVALGLSLSSVQRRLADGTLRSVTVGRRRLIPLGELERLCQPNDNEAAA